jgi:WD40 repeat protein
MTYRNTTSLGKFAVWAGVTMAYLASSSASAQEPRLTFLGHAEEVRCVAISPDGKTLASGAGNTIRFWTWRRARNRRP